MPLDPSQLHLSQTSGVPFYRQVQDQLTQLMASGGLAPGEKLPSVRALAAALLVSVITTRRAYDELERKGLIQQLRGRGSFVANDVVARCEQDASQDAAQDLLEAVSLARRRGLTAAQIHTIIGDELSLLEPK